MTKIIKFPTKIKSKKKLLFLNEINKESSVEDIYQNLLKAFKKKGIEIKKGDKNDR